MLDLFETKIEVDGHRAEIGQSIDTNPLFPSVEFERSTVARIGMKLFLASRFFSSTRKLYSLLK